MQFDNLSASGNRRSPEHPGTRIKTIMIARWAPPLRVAVLTDSKRGSLARSKTRICIFIMLAVLISNVQAAPVRLRVIPKGTNQIVFTFGPVVPGVVYEVLARTNG